MNATRWPSLTEFAKYLGREGICRVEDTDKGLHIAWIDNSPEALRRQDAIRKKERQDKGDEEREQKMIKEQIKRAQMDAETKTQGEDNDGAWELNANNQGEKIKISFGTKPKETKDLSPPATIEVGDAQVADKIVKEDSEAISPPLGVSTPPPEKVSMKMGTNSKPKNVFAVLPKKNELGGRGSAKAPPKRPMSEAERIMKEEIQRKRNREDMGGQGFNNKRSRVA